MSDPEEDEAVNRRVLWTCLIATPVVMFLLFCSMLGSLTGVFSYDGRPFGMDGVGYLVRRGDDWYAVHGDLGAGGGLMVDPVDTRDIKVEQGLWAVTMTSRQPNIKLYLTAYSSWNFFVIYDLTGGRFSNLGR